MASLVTLLVFGLAIYVILTSRAAGGNAADTHVPYYSLSLRSGDSLDRAGNSFRSFGD